MNIVGISAYFHDSACCVIKDGHLVAAVEEERLSRVKHDPSLPQRAFRYCLEEAGLTVADIDCVAYYEDPVKKLSRQLWVTFPRPPKHKIDPQRPRREIREILGFEGPVHVVDHHGAHAASSFYFSGYDESAIMTFDGVGEWATTTYGTGKGHEIDIFEQVDFPHSVGLLYSTITAYLGFEVNDGEYKVMGLAPYGKPRYTDEVRTLIRMGPAGQYTLALEYFEFLKGQRMFSDKLPELFRQPARTPESDVDEFHQDVAKSLQVVLEELLLEKARYLHGRTGSENLCMAGGVALNCVANGRLSREGPFKRIFVQPASSDAGGALGAAAAAWAHLTRSPLRQRGLPTAYLGPEYTPGAVRDFFANQPLKTHDFAGREADLIEAAVDRLERGDILGWFQGRLEFGPRALGARSIIADPRHPGMRDKINALVKKREAFRPFAPVVLESRAKEHFELTEPSPFMLFVCQVNSKLDLPAITHVDGSARVQTVNSESNPRFAALLAAFERRTGCPILLNTSFNMRGEPMVCSPLDGFLCFIRSRLDTLVMEDTLVDKVDLPPNWYDLVRSFGARERDGVKHAVYTFV